MLRALQGEAAQARAFGFGLLCAQYAAKLADARQRFSGDALAAALAAIQSEQRAAEQALRRRLAGEARDWRAGVPRHVRGHAPRRRSPRRPSCRRQRAQGEFAR